jgi:gliding motility-associated-like protein
LIKYKDTTIIDEFTYSENMHFQLLDNETGVSLERINFDKPTQDVNNWHSASEYVGFATPAYKNSQYSEGVNSGEKPVVVEPYMFSPNNDGIEDFANINYKFEKPGYVATIIVFDAKGRLVKQLANNLLLSTEGTIIWDGLYDNNNLAPAGTYLIYFKIFDLDGNISEYKIPVVSARRF